MRNAAEKRHRDYMKAIRKRRIDRERDPSPNHHDWYDNLHQYSKNKIHCSCPICRNYYCMRDRRRLERIKFDEDEYLEEDLI